MRDILRTARLDPAFLAAARLHLVETSARLRDIQRATLAGAASQCTWCDDIAALPALPLLFVANELFDAVPVRQIEKTARGWCERRVGIDPEGALRFLPGPPLGDLSILPQGASEQTEGAIFEYAPAREAIASELGLRLAQDGGAALLIDYGHLQSGFADTLQAMRSHRFVSVFGGTGRRRPDEPCRFRGAREGGIGSRRHGHETDDPGSVPAGARACRNALGRLAAARTN